MQNKITDLNNHLFAELERLGNESLKGDELRNELARADKIAKVAREVISSSRLVLSAEIAVGEGLIKRNEAHPMLALESK